MKSGVVLSHPFTSILSFLENGARKMAKKKKPQGSRGTEPKAETPRFSAGPICGDISEIKKGDLVFVDPTAEERLDVCRRLGFKEEELGRLPLKVLRTEPVHGRVFVEGRRVDGVETTCLRRAEAIKTNEAMMAGV